MISATDISGFLDRYRVFTRTLDRARFDHFQRAFRSLGAGVQSLLAMSCELERQRASGFNLFRILGVAYLEVSTHSAILANLLDPRGSHAQGHVFFHAFLATLRSVRSCPPGLDSP